LNPIRKYNLLRASLLVSLSALAFLVPVIAASTASYHQNGHIRIVNGASAGLSVSPTFLEFGNVTWGSTLTRQIMVTNTGDCNENVTVAAGQNLQPTVMATIPSLAPAHSIIVNATYDTRVFNAPGDYTFGIDWTAICL